MKTTFIITGVRNGIAFLQPVGKRWVAMTTHSVGKKGERTVLAPSQYVTEEELPEFRRLWKIYRRK